MSKPVKPRRTFLDRSARSTRRIANSRRRASSSRSNSAHAVALRHPLRGAPVDRQRIGAHPHLAAVALHDAALHVDLEVHQVAAALEEVAPVGARVEADDVVGQQAVVDLVADLGREHAPGVRLRPRDVHEVVQEGVRPRAADHRRQRVELVVVDHDDRLVDAVDLLEHRLGEVLVDDVVAELERLDLVAADVRGVALVPEVVLDEPEHRVGEDVVEAVVGLRVGGDEAHAELAAVRAPRSRTPGRRAPRPDLDVALGHRRRDPDRVAMRGEADQRGRETAGPALDRAVLLVGDRPAVGDQHERCARRSDMSEAPRARSAGNRAGSAA